MAEYSTEHLDYLARAFLDQYREYEGPIATQDIAYVESKQLSVLRVTQIGRTWTTTTNNRVNGEQTAYRTADLLAGCNGAKLPVIFSLLAEQEKIDLILGVFSRVVTGGRHRPNTDTLESLIRAHYPGSRLEQINSKNFHDSIIGKLRTGHTGLITGTPGSNSTNEIDIPTQLDRVIRGMTGHQWGMVLFAEPLTGTVVHDFYHAAINEMRTVDNAEQRKTRRSPLAETYLEKLDFLRKELDQGMASGLWTVSLFYFSPNESAFDSLGSILSSNFVGESSELDPIRTIRLANTSGFERGIGPILRGTIPSPGQFEYPYSFQTLLNSKRLANFMHLPRLEAPGFTVRDIHRFDVVPPQYQKSSSIPLGTITDLGNELEQDYYVPTERLKKHSLLVGVTGSGKTNTSFRLLRELWGVHKIPFLVIEPAKAEYRTLLSDPIFSSDLCVFTLGDESVSPFRMNPFYVEYGDSVSTHIDLLKSTFNASFAMWHPLPAVLERCIHEIYLDHGWDPVRNLNERLLTRETDENGETQSWAFPTLTDLASKVNEVVDKLGYHERVTSDIKAALVTRLNSLLIGGKGAMLDTRHSVPIKELLSRPVIIELERVGDDDEKAFLMGLLMTRLYEYLRINVEGVDMPLRHITVVEEAHRLLANIPTSSIDEQANTRGKAVETFVNMLSEVRSYGEGFLIAEQIPTKLAPDVLKNTDLKVIHRTMAGDDRDILANLTNMDADQSKMLATLDPLQAAVFSGGDDRPILVKIPFSKPSPPTEVRSKKGSDKWVANHMQSFNKRLGLTSLFEPFSTCREVCKSSYAYCDEAQKIVGLAEFKELFSVFILSVVTNSEASETAFRRLKWYISQRASSSLALPEALHCIFNHAIHRYLSFFGKQYSWPYATITRLQLLLTNILQAIVEPKTRVLDMKNEAIYEFRDIYKKACKRKIDPLPVCQRVCPSKLCLFRHHVDTLTRDGWITQRLIEAIDVAQRSHWQDIGAVNDLHNVLYHVSEKLIGSPTPTVSASSAALCYGAHMLANDPRLSPLTRTVMTEELIKTFESENTD